MFAKKYNAIVPKEDVPSIPVTCNGKTGFVKVPRGLKPGAIFQFKEKEVFQKAAPIATVAQTGPVYENAPVMSMPSSIAVPPPVTVFTPFTPLEVTPAIIYPIGPEPVGYSQDGMYKESVSTAPSAVIYTNPAPVTYITPSAPTEYVVPSAPPSTTSYTVQVPANMEPGQTFHCIVNHEKVTVVVPAGGYPGMYLTIQGSAPSQSPPIVYADHVNIPVANVMYCDRTA